MNYDAVKTYCLNKPEAELDYPFGPDVAVFKVKQKLFALLTVRNQIEQVNLKCDPDRAQALRDLFEAVIPGYHMNKKHWNTVLLNHEVPPGEISAMIDHSYGLIVKGLKRVDRDGLLLRHGAEAIFGGG